MVSLTHRRIGAFLIDLLIYAALWIILYFNFKLGDYLSWILASGYLLIKDGILHGQSLGKFLLRIRVVGTETGSPASLRSSLERNAILLVPNLFRFLPFIGSLLLLLVYAWETYLLFSHPEGQRWGDLFARTRVVSLDDDGDSVRER